MAKAKVSNIRTGDCAIRASCWDIDKAHVGKRENKLLQMDLPL